MSLLNHFRFARCRSLLQDKAGAALIEFAMVLPVLILCYLGGFQLMEAVSVYRKVTTSTRSIADLTSRSSSVNAALLSTYLDASAQIMAPYRIDRGTFRVSLIRVDNAGTGTVAWSRSKNGTALVTGAAYTLPAGVVRPNLDIVVCDVTYNYQPVAFSSLLGNLPFKDQIFMVPRGGPTISIS